MNGDGSADVCARATDGVYCASSTGGSFGPMTQWQSQLTNAAGWAAEPYWNTIEYPDVDGNGSADLCARGSAGISCALSTGTGFGTLSLWQNEMSDAGGWASDPSHWATLQYPDLNGDGRADVCARATDGVYCALSSGTKFSAITQWQAQLSNAAGWHPHPSRWATIQFPDVNGDGKADLCARDDGGVNCALSSGSGFGALTVWRSEFDSATAYLFPRLWQQDPSRWATIQFPDLDRDGKADFCVRNVHGLLCAFSNGTGFGAYQAIGAALGDSDGWNKPDKWRTLSLAGRDTRPRAVGRILKSLLPPPPP